MDRGTLAITFSEAMSNATDDVDWTGVSLRTHVNGLEGSGVTLWNTQGEPGWGETDSKDAGLTLAVRIHPTDLDEMKAAYVGHNSSFTWLTLRGDSFVALDDRDGNEPVYGTQVVGHQGASVLELVEDTTSTWLSPSNASSLLCSSAELGRRQGSSNSASRREIVLHLDEPCAVEAAVTTYNATNGTSPQDEANTTTAEAFVGGYPSDWSMLVAAGVLLEDDDAGGAAIRSATNNNVSLVLNATSSFVTDLSAAANPLVAVVDLEESFPDCQPCGNGTYRSEPCTEVYDAVCATCAETCAGGDHFVLSPCTAETGLDCHPILPGFLRPDTRPPHDPRHATMQGCTPCAFGTREIGECQQASDRVCEACTECEDAEYESRECRTSGEDRICETCLRCSLSPEVAEACRDSRSVRQWQTENCCETAVGEKIPCPDVALENLRVSAATGRWQWGRGQPAGGGDRARDGVTPRDRLIEVEFRAGAKTVFDDPRYVGQEGPTGAGSTGEL
ncbi:conserved unknown protein [Ectocarpus siliculosus]|uniref:TNFR-Cys domain-containing protein n=1 Tax=Ectocarpus siliculosus TaxID=2880 RepID=D8LAW6_ECTSI|nr:conserved unknown protein [Ectocarpus siliculosus]|eukprot:CBN76475.1 conserved unknown protein [Ectocarpus siliculosus]